MKSIVSLVATLLMAAASFATPYTWTGGGTAGKWDDPANWGGDGWPTGGDTATVGTAITLTSDFEIGAGDLVINASATVTFDCVISGAGGLYNKGTGSLALKKDNTFSGGVKTDAATTSRSACIDLYAGGGLGSGQAYIEKSSGQKGSRLNVYGPVTVTTPVSFGPDGANNGTLWTTNDVTFAAKVYPNSRFIMYTAGGGGTLTFEDVNTGYGNWFPKVGRNDTVIFNCPAKFSSGADIHSATANGVSNGGRVIFKTTGNDMPYLHVQSDSFVFDAENALPPVYKKLRFENNDTRLDICGHDQTISSISMEFFAPTSYTNYGFTNSTETAASVVFEGLATGLTDFTFGGQLFGKTGFKWAPDSSAATFTFSSKSQPTTGDLVVSNGTVALTGGATFTSLARLEIDETGVLSFDEASGESFKATELVLATGAKIRTGAKTGMTVSSASTNGVALATGYYGKNELPDVVTGNGLLYVEGLPAGAHAWTGAAGNGLWNDAGNWGGEVPQAGEDVVIRDGVVTNDVSTPALKSLYLVGETTLTVSGWNTKIEAETLNLLDDSVVTCADGGTTAESISRVWIVCANLLVGVDARIDLDGKGYAAAPYRGVRESVSGYGPGAGSYRYGASHGGPGGANVGAGALFGCVYDDPTDPELPGSSGYWETRYRDYAPALTGHAGGGVLKVEASGVMTVYGTVSADGESAWCVNMGGSYNDTAGAGGAINIVCARFVAQHAVVRAEGGTGDGAVNPSWQLAGPGFGQPGGGGLIAIRYGDGQAASDVANTTISAACGLYKGTSAPVSLANQDLYWSNADLGSVWFTDAKLVESTLGTGLSGRVVHPVGYTTAGDLTISSGYVRFEGEGVSLSVGGDLTVSGASARLEVGGLCYTNRSTATDLYCGTTPVGVSVGGDLMISDGGRFDLRAAATNGVDRFGATATIGGALSVGNGSWLVTWCDVLNTGAPAFEVGGDFTVAAGGIVSASRRGGSGGWNGGLYSPSVAGVVDHGFGVGRGYRGAAGSYGGRGGVGKGRTQERIAVVGNAFYPTLPGSGGGAASHGMAGSGGGLVFVKAAGAITVDGMVEADGGYSYYLGADAIHNVTAGSGGAIFLSGRTFAGAGTLSTKGGDAMVDWYTPKGETDPVWLCSGAGGGGRIAVWTGEPVDESVRPTSWRVTSAETPIAGEGNFTGTAVVGGGDPVYRREATETQRVPLADESVGEAGTVKFCKLEPRQGMLLFVR